MPCEKKKIKTLFQKINWREKNQSIKFRMTVDYEIKKEVVQQQINKGKHSGSNGDLSLASWKPEYIKVMESHLQNTTDADSAGKGDCAFG